jgi:hypothetical protein
MREKEEEEDKLFFRFDDVEWAHLTIFNRGCCSSIIFEIVLFRK